MQYLIIGAGVTGLSAAVHLPRDSATVLEAEDDVGGICRTVAQDGFLFDRAGHFLHMRDARTREFVDELLPGHFENHVRRSAIHIAGRFVPHPFQAHLAWLPPGLQRECLADFVGARERQALEPAEAAPHLLEWFRRVFGEGITKYFLEPQNRKTYCCDLTELASQWAVDYVPQPSVAQVIEGALFRSAPSMLGYNAQFSYPREGGIHVLAHALAERVRNIRCGQRVISIDCARQLVTCADGNAYQYEMLISTMPLKTLVSLTAGLPFAIYAVAQGLRSVDVLDIRLGINGGVEVPYHWIYFPELRYPFCRVVIPSNVSSTLAPKGMSTVHIEVNCASNVPLDSDKTTIDCIGALADTGILSGRTRVLTQATERIRSAYVIHDHYREKVLPQILAALRERNIFSVGRYGGWTYGGIGSALLEGMDIVSAIGKV